MTQTQTAELPIVYKEFLDYLATADDVRVIGPSQVSTPGLRVWLLIDGHWKAYRISDQLAATQITSSGLSVAAVSNAFPTTLTQTLGVRMPANQLIQIAASSGLSSGRLSCAAATPTQFAAAPAVSVNNFLIKNLDTINSVELGGVGFGAGTGYILETLGTSDDSVLLRFVI